MGCDAYADENGKFKMLIRVYPSRDKEDVRHVEREFNFDDLKLDPKARIYFDIIEGDER